MSAEFKDMKRCEYSDEVVLQTMVSDVIQDGAGPKRRERFVLEDHNNTFSCVTATGKIGLLRAGHEGETKRNAKEDGWSTGEEIHSEESPIRWGQDDTQDKADCWSTGRSDASGDGR